MRRALARPMAGVILAVAVFSWSVPAAGAGPLFSSGGTHKEKVVWIAAAWAWLGGLWGWNPGTRVPLTTPQATDNTEMTRWVGATGPCVDPWGYPIACVQGKAPQIVLSPTDSPVL
jgi:hypothetical protein